MKDHEIASQTNALDMKSLGFDSDIDKLTGQLADVQDSTDPATTIENAVSGGGGAIEGMATMKKLYSKFKDMKTKAGEKFNEVKGKAQDKFDELKGKAQDKVDDLKSQAEDGSNDLEDRLNALKEGGRESKTDEPDGENPDEFAYSSDKPGVPQANKAQRGDTDGDGEGGGDDVDAEPSGLTDAQQGVLDDFENGLPQEEMDAMDAAPAPSGGGQEIEMTDMSKQPEVTGDHNVEIAQNDPATAGRELELDMDTLDSEAQSATKTLSSDTSALESATEGLGEAGEVAGEAAGEVGDVAADIGEGVAEAGMEAAGTARCHRNRGHCRYRSQCRRPSFGCSHRLGGRINQIHRRDINPE